MDAGGGREGEVSEVFWVSRSSVFPQPACSMSTAFLMDYPQPACRVVVVYLEVGTAV